MNHIEIIDGKAVIRGHNVKVKMVAGMYLKAGATVEQVMEQYNLSRAEVHAALAYYYDNQAVFQQEAEELEPLVEAARASSEKRLQRMREKRRLSE